MRTILAAAAVAAAAVLPAPPATAAEAIALDCTRRWFILDWCEAYGTRIGQVFITSDTVSEPSGPACLASGWMSGQMYGAIDSSFVASRVGGVVIMLLPELNAQGTGVAAGACDLADTWAFAVTIAGA